MSYNFKVGDIVIHVMSKSRTLKGRVYKIIATNTPTIYCSRVISPSGKVRSLGTWSLSTPENYNIRLSQLITRAEIRAAAEQHRLQQARIEKVKFQDEAIQINSWFPKI